MDRNQDLKKQFENQALSDFPTQQTISIKINAEKYSIVGQKTYNSVLFSHYDVFDSYGNRADNKEATLMYKYLSMFELIDLLEIQEWLFRYPDSQTEFNNQGFKGKFGEEINELVDENDRFRLLLQKLINEKNKIANMSDFDINNFISFQLAWDSFWEEYEPRIKTLFELREYVWEENLNVAIRESNLNNVYQEADIMYLIFSGSLSIRHPIMTNIDDLIKVAGETGRVSSEGIQNLHLTNFERFSKHLFKKGYLVLLLAVFPITLICMLFGTCSYLLVLTVLIIGITLYTADAADIRGRRIKIKKRSELMQKEKLANHWLIKKKYSQAYQNLKVSEQKAIEASFEFVAVPTILWRGLLVVTIVTSIMGIVLLSDNNEDHDYGYIWMSIAGVFLLLRFLLPLTNFGNMRFQLTPNSLKIGKRAIYYLNDVLILTLNKRGSILTVDNHFLDPQKYTLKKSDRKKIKEELVVWCDKHNVTFREKVSFTKFKKAS